MESALRPIWVHDSLRDAAVAKRRSDSLARGVVDHFFHYQGARQAQLWLEVHRAHAPLFADDAYREIFRALYAEVVPAIAGPDVHVVALGPGAGSKEQLLLEALARRGLRVRYTPIDASVELACLSADAAPAGATVDAVAADLSMLTSLRAWLDARSPATPRIFTAFGIAPNFAPDDLFGRLSSVLRENDRLLLSANLAGVSEDEDAYGDACRAIFRQYDNPQTLRWLTQVLDDWDLRADLSEPSFSIGDIEGIRGFIASSAWLHDVAFTWEDRPFSARTGDALRLFFSLRYTPGRLAAALERHSLALGPGRITPDEREGVWLVRRATP